MLNEDTGECEEGLLTYQIALIAVGGVVAVGAVAGARNYGVNVVIFKFVASSATTSTVLPAESGPTVKSHPEILTVEQIK